MLKSPLLPIFLTVFVDVLGLTIVLPLLPAYAEHFGATAFIATTLTASYALCQFVSGPILGRASDRAGRKPVLLVSQAGTFVAFMILARASSLWMLFIGRMIDGSTAGNLAIAQAYISDVTKPENRTKSFAIIGIAFGLGFTIGPALSGMLGKRDLSAPFYLAAALSALSVFLTATLLPNRKPERQVERKRSEAFKKYFSEYLPRRRLLVFMVYIFSFSTLISGLALFLERQMHYGVQEIGYIYTFSGVVGGLFQGGVIGRLVKRLGEAKLALIGFAAMTAVAFIGASHALGALLVVTAISSFGNAMTRPSLTTLLTKSVSTSEQGAILGLNQSLNSVAQVIAPLTAGWLIGKGMLLEFGLASGAWAALGMVLMMRERPDAPEAAPGAPNEPVATTTT